MAVPMEHFVDVAGPQPKFPLSTAAERTRLLPPVFVNVTVWMALDWPTATLPKFTEVGE
jgi:hypothetical protein